MSVISTIWNPHSSSFDSHHQTNAPDEVHHHRFQFPTHKQDKSNAFLEHKAQPREHFLQNGPDSDIRETQLAYCIEIETPGVTDKKNISIQHIPPRTLIVEGTAQRPRIGVEELLEDHIAFDQEHQANGSSMNGHDGGKAKTQRQEEDDSAPRLLLGERKVGLWRRSFTLASDFDPKTIKAKLQGGLLSITLPKREQGIDPQFKIEIE